MRTESAHLVAAQRTSRKALFLKKEGFNFLISWRSIKTQEKTFSLSAKWRCSSIVKWIGVKRWSLHSSHPNFGSFAVSSRLKILRWSPDGLFWISALRPVKVAISQKSTQQRDSLYKLLASKQFKRLFLRYCPLSSDSAAVRRQADSKNVCWLN